MKAKKKELVNDLLVTLASQLSGIAPADQKTPKGVQKAIRHLAAELLRARSKEEKRLAKAATLKPKEVKQRLTDELVAVLDAHFAEDVLEARASQLLTETAAELADKLTKLRGKQAQKASKNDLAVTELIEASVVVAAPAPRATRRVVKAAPAVDESQAG